jgi:hypothetical protein
MAVTETTDVCNKSLCRVFAGRTDYIDGRSARIKREISEAKRNQRTTEPAEPPISGVVVYERALAVSLPTVSL